MKDITIEDFEIIRDRLIRERYEERLIQFRKLITVIRYGIIKETDAEFSELQQWLTENFKKEYLELF